MAERVHRLGKNKGRERICCDCSKVEIVRVDNPGVRCQKCQSIVFADIGRAMRRPLQLTLKFGRRAPRVNRLCKGCLGYFQVRANLLEGRTNASANFCSTGCYHNWLCDTARVTGRGSRWRHHRAEALRRAPFCAMCPTFKGLQVHHIVPYRITFDNAQDNLVPLCRRHHRFVETVTVDALGQGVPPDIVKLTFGSMLREQQDVGRAMIIGVLRERKAAA